jgi:hypothetical protein
VLVQSTGYAGTVTFRREQMMPEQARRRALEMLEGEGYTVVRRSSAIGPLEPSSLPNDVVEIFSKYSRIRSDVGDQLELGAITGE